MKQQIIRLIRYPGLKDLEIVNNRTTLYRWIKDGRFPKPIRLGPNSVAWRWSAIEEWLAAREAEKHFPNEPVS